jgi:type I restriction enzyme S subunit
MVSEWRKVKINEIAEISRGISWKSSEEFDSYQEGTIRVYKIPHIQPNSRFQLENNKVYIRKPSNYEKYLLGDNDILMVGSNGNPERVGNVVRYKKSENALFASFLLRLRAKEYIDHEFLYYRLLNPDIQNAITDESAGSTGLRNINALKMGELSFQLPPLNEQRKIAAILSSVDEAIEKTETIIEQTEKVKKGLMQQLLTKGIGHTKFKKTVIGKIPEEWKVVDIDSVSTLKGRIGWRGYTKQDLRDSGPLVIGATQISPDNKLNLSKPVYLSWKKYEESPEIKISKGDIILVKTGNTIGKVAIVDKEIGPATINPNTALLKEIQCNNTFLFYNLASHRVQKAIQEAITVGAQPSINQATLKAIKIPLPSKKEQEQIVNILSSIDGKIEKEQQKLIQLRIIKKGLMQVLFTGKVRVKVDDEVMSQ